MRVGRYTLESAIPFFLGLFGAIGTGLTPVNGAADKPLALIDCVVNWPTLIFLRSDIFILLTFIPTFIVNALGWFLVGLLLIGMLRLIRIIIGRFSQL